MRRYHYRPSHSTMSGRLDHTALDIILAAVPWRVGGRVGGVLYCAKYLPLGPGVASGLACCGVCCARAWTGGQLIQILGGGRA